MALPCLHLIARSFPRAERVLLTNFPVHTKAPAAAVVLGDSGLIHRYMRYSLKSRNPFELARLWWKLRRFRPDVLVYLMPIRTSRTVRRDALFFKLAGAKTVVGLPSSSESMHKFDKASGMFESEASRLARSVRVLGSADLDKPASWDLLLTRKERRTAAEALNQLSARRFLVCAPGTKMQAKDWGVDNWAALVSRLAQSFTGHGLVLVGAHEDRETCEKVAQGWSGPRLNLSGLMSPRETAAVIESADLFMGPDSGPMHLAAAVGTPCVIAFSARGKRGIWYPQGAIHRVLYRSVDCCGCNLETCTVERKKCLTSISVDEMYQAAIAALIRPAEKQLLKVAGAQPSNES